MVMSITFALQQKPRDEQNSLCKAVELLMQSPGYIQVLNRPRTTGFPLLVVDSALVRRRYTVTSSKVCIIAY